MRIAPRTGPRPGGKVKCVEPDGIAAEVGLEPGDEIVAINAVEATDVLDFRFGESAARVMLDFKKPGGQFVSVEIEKDPDDVLGVEFEDDLFDGIRTCRNNCPFCFVVQNPRGMRRTLYIKDEDYRYSFLHANYITLSNLSEGDWHKLVRMRLSPLYVSIHATEPELRRRLLGTREGRPILEPLRRLAAERIDFYGQIVAIPGWNDGPELERTLTDLLPLRPHFQGLAVVPVGLTRHREKLPHLAAYQPDTALQMIRHGEALGRAMHRAHGQRLVYLADEFYLMAELPVPPRSYYEGYALREDGVGMIRKFVQDFRRALPGFLRRRLAAQPGRTILATGRGAARMFSRVVMPALAPKRGLELELRVVENRFFGESVTVAGLLTGSDYHRALAGTVGGSRVLVPACSLRADGAVFLDDVTPAGLSADLGATVEPVPDSAVELLRRLWGYAPREGDPAALSSAEVAVYGG